MKKQVVRCDGCAESFDPDEVEHLGDCDLHFCDACMPARATVPWTPGIASECFGQISGGAVIQMFRVMRALRRIADRQPTPDTAQATSSDIARESGVDELTVNGAMILAGELGLVVFERAPIEVPRPLLGASGSPGVA